MKTTKFFLIVLLCIVIVISLLRTVKVEEFITNDGVAENPEELSVTSFLRDVKKWDTSSAYLTDGERKVLATMRVLQSKSYSLNNQQYPLMEALVIPAQHLPIYKIDANNKSSIWLAPVKDSDILSWIKKPETNLETDSPPRDYDNIIELKYTQQDETPEGLVIDIRNMPFSRFKSILRGLYEMYDIDFLTEMMFYYWQIKNIQNKINEKINEYNLYLSWTNIWKQWKKDLETQYKPHIDNYNALNAEKTRIQNC